MIKQRKSNRLKDYDYSQNGLYFITICTKNRINYFGKIEDGKMMLNKYGQIANDYWEGQIKVHKDLLIDEFVVMPNHVHGILGLFNESVEDAYLKSNRSNLHKKILNDNINSKLQSQKMRPLQIEIDYDRSNMRISQIIQIYKSKVTKLVKRLSTKPNNTIPSIWQRSCYDHIIRNERSLNNIREYIHYNPLKWEWDIENSSCISPGKNYYTKLFV